MLVIKTYCNIIIIILALLSIPSLIRWLRIVGCTTDTHLQGDGQSDGTCTGDDSKFCMPDGTCLGR